MNNRKGVEYSPLLIEGGNGVGKTHLVRAIENEMKHKEKVLRIKCGDFIDELRDDIKENRVAEFREKYINLDLFILEDIYFISGKERIQDEINHILNELLQKRKKVIITTCYKIEELDIERRIKSVILSGLQREITKPTERLKLEIIKNRTTNKNSSGIDYIG